VWLCLRSDVLGQVMPLVGRDWTQSGVTRLFSAIKVLSMHKLFLLSDPFAMIDMTILSEVVISLNMTSQSFIYLKF